MTAIITAFWKPIAALLALILGGLGLYAKGRADARQRAKSEATEAKLETIKEVRRHERKAEKRDDSELVRRLTR
jgi:hypothetical protein